MCCLFYIDDDTLRDIARIVSQRINTANAGDIHPTDKSYVITASGKSLVAKQMGFGTPGFEKHQLLLNARAETALQKKSFSDSVMRRRCIIPAKKFYEWDKKKNKVTFSLPGQDTMYMAGFYKYVEEDPRFMIMTTAANASMQPVHDRMPLILPENQISDWIYDDKKVAAILGQTSPLLETYREFEQMTLF